MAKIIVIFYKLKYFLIFPFDTIFKANNYSWYFSFPRIKRFAHAERAEKSLYPEILIHGIKWRKQRTPNAARTIIGAAGEFAWGPIEVGAHEFGRICIRDGGRPVDSVENGCTAA